MRHKLSQCVKKPYPHWHYKQFCPNNDGPTNNTMIFPEGEQMSFQGFTNDDICFACGKAVLSEHGIFMFNNSPDAIRLHPKDPEWQPGPESDPIPMDNGPGRVAYVWAGENFPSFIGDPIVMVHEGDYEGIWTPCNAAYQDEIAWYWICRLMAPKDPAKEDFMRSISS